MTKRNPVAKAVVRLRPSAVKDRKKYSRRSKAVKSIIRGTRDALDHVTRS